MRVATENSGSNRRICIHLMKFVSTCKSNFKLCVIHKQGKLTACVYLREGCTQLFGVCTRQNHTVKILCDAYVDDRSLPPSLSQHPAGEVAQGALWLSLRFLSAGPSGQGDVVN